MQLWSKLVPEVQHLNCKDFAHPWTDNCFIAAVATWLQCSVGAAGFFGLLYLCQYVSKVLKQQKKAKLSDFLRIHFRSTIFGATLATCIFFSHCMLRKLTGKFYTPTLVFLPAFLGGFAVYIESKRGRDLCCNAFFNCCLQLWVRDLEQSNILRWNPNTQTFIFMILCSLLSFLLSWKNFDLNCFWFFDPPKVKKTNDKDACFHDGDCKKQMSRLFIMYSMTGLVLQSMRLFANHFKNPKFILFSLTRPKTFKLAAFLGGYAVIYQAIRCFLYQKEKKYSLVHDGLAGFLAGAAFRFQPTIPILNSAFITTAQLLTEVGCRRKILPNLHYSEMVFAWSCGLLFHYRLLGDYCPQLMTYFMSTVTHGLADKIRLRFDKVLKDYNHNLGTFKSS